MGKSNHHLQFGVLPGEDKQSTTTEVVVGGRMYVCHIRRVYMRGLYEGWLYDAAHLDGRRVNHSAGTCLGETQGEVIRKLKCEIVKREKDK